jgi:penicillin-binding protein 1C
VVAEYRSSEATLLDRRRRVIHQQRFDLDGRRLEWTTLNRISPALVGAVIHAEDRRFYQHEGVNWLSLTKGLLGPALFGEARGASTITMQLASLLNASLRPQSRRRSLGQKWGQLREAAALERRWTKSEIMEGYLNLATFRGELQGVAAASRGLFGKEPHGLTQVEALLLAALLRAPNAPLERVAERGRLLGQSLGWVVERGALYQKAAEALRGSYRMPRSADLAPHVAAELFRTNADRPAKLEVVCTLDGDMQLFAREAMREQLAALRSRNVVDAALLAVENWNGEVVAYLGNAGNRAEARYVDGVRALRQAGSILKPFLYALAFDQRVLTPASLIEDAPLDIPVLGGVYRPRNYDDEFHGLVTARTALASSLNVPAVKTLGLVGVAPFVSKLEEFGLEDLERPDFYGPSLALGSADVCLYDLVEAYSALANEGMAQSFRVTFSPGPALPPRQVISREAAFLTADILSDRESRALTFDLENPLSTRFWSAVKTGTSKDMRDNWCVGFSQRYTVGVWVGNFSGAPMSSVSGVTGAAPIWLKVMNYLHRGLPSQPPAQPPGVRRVLTETASGGGLRDEWYLQGTEPSDVEAVSAAGRSRIVYPVEDAILAVDPDIPDERQVVFFQAENAKPGWTWRLDEKKQGPAGALSTWTPQIGKHKLALLDETGRVIDRVRFEVR